MSYGIVATTTTEGRKMINKNCTKLVAAMGIMLSAGSAQAVNIAVNGDLETGDLTGWTTFDNAGTITVTNAQANGGTYSLNLVASVAAPGDPASFPVAKNANIGIGIVQPNSSATISFDLYGSLSGAGGVIFSEFFSELSGGGTSSSVILGGGPIFPTDTWTHYEYTTPTGFDVSGGVTLQLKADCGANPGCTVDAYFDNITVDVATPAVPIPAAAWLFGSGLLGLVGVARRKSRS
jgi:hypothetical protein